MKALILVGMQVDFMPGGAMEKPGSLVLIPLVNRWMKEVDLVVAANFWLPANHVIFAANRIWRKPGQAIEVEGEQITLQPMFCVQDSFGAEFAPGLQIEKIEKTFLMGTNSAVPPHSAFFDRGNQPTGLEIFLKNKNAVTIFVSGIPGEPHVLETIRDGASLGFNITLLAP